MTSSLQVSTGIPILSLDTHILIFALQGELMVEEEELLRRNDWCIASIVLWEIAKLSQLGRISLSPTDPRLRSSLERITVWPLDLRIAEISTRLDFKSDPADEIIAATSVVHGIKLVTRDERIRASSLVPLAIR